jgi:hypothetical protein
MEKKNIVLLDCKEQDIFKKEFEVQHAARIFALQKQQKRNDWTLSEGQNFELTNGALTERTNSDNPERRKSTRRTSEL